MDEARATAKIEVWEGGLSTDEKADIKGERDKRKAIRSRVTKGINKLNDAITNGNKYLIIKSAENLKKAHDDLEQTDQRIWAFMGNDDIIEADVVLGEKWSDSAIDALAKSDEALDQMIAHTSGPSPSAPATSTQAKLPKVELPKFTGKSPAEYQTFWNSFESLIDKRTDMAKVQKLIYLKSCCTDEASELADGYNLTDDNYDNFSKALKDMYGIPRLIQQSHVENILNLQPFKANNVKPFLTTLETSLRCLAEYSIDMENLAPMIIPHVESLMPKEIFQKWREEIHDDDSFSSKKLIEFLHERLQCCTSSPEQKSDAKNKDVKPKTTSMLTSASKEVTCFCCEKPNHRIAECDAFKRMSVNERSEFLYKKRHCQRCMLPCSKEHFTRICKAAIKCKICKRPHQTLLHRDRQSSNQPENQQNAKSTSAASASASASNQHESSAPTTESANFVISSKSSSSEQTSANALHHASIKQERLTVLKNFQARPKGKPNFTVRSAIDDGSQKTWILQKTATALKLPVIRRTLLAVATAFTDEYNSPKLYDVVKISLQTKDKGCCFDMEAVVSQSKKLTVDMDPIHFDPAQKYPHLEDIEFADHYPRDAAEIELLIGNDYADNVQTGRRRVGKSGDPIAIHTIFGWVLSGRIHQEATSLASTNLTPVVELENALEKFWKIEEIPSPKTRLKNLLEEKVHEEFKKAITYNEVDQQYRIEIPYKEDVTKLCDNYISTKALYLKQQEKLKNDPEKRNTVHKIFAEQLQLGVLELVSSTETTANKVHYLPWHLVIRPGHPTTPVRIVKNASFKGRNGLSLNGIQHVGPNLLPDIVGSILRFRSRRIGFISDIKKMFWQIKIPENQQDLHRIITPDGIARQTTVMFGESSSPFLAMATCHYHAEREDIKQKFPDACKFILEELYMDDIPGGADTMQHGVEVLTQLQGFFASMHMYVHKINSNCKEMLEQIEGTDNSKETIVLGLKWDTHQDSLEIPVKEWEDVPSTKRELLQKIATIWDPFGGRSPLTCKGKMIMQRTWQDGSGWDEPLSDDLKREVESFKNATSSTFAIPRFFGNPTMLHIFVDASEAAYAAVAYALSEKGSCFLLSKTRVKPIKVVTLPRMELLGALLGTRLLQFLKDEVFKSEIKTMMWTDSTITLGWIVSSSSKYKQFVGNRIAEIQRTSASPSIQWKWVPGDQNPADIPSRGIWPLDQEKSKLWLEGPEFLKTGDWPEQPTVERPDLEVRKVAMNVVPVKQPVVDMDRFSSLEKLLRTMVHVIRFGCPLGARDQLSVAEQRKRAMEKLISQDQKAQFSEEIECLQKNQPLPKNSRLLQFNPFLENGIMKMKGRVSDNLILLSDKSQLTRLLIRDVHIRNLHTGPNQTLAFLRQNYWIIKGMAAVKQEIRSCMICKKINKPMCQQKMADLPDFRKAPHAPFSHTGLDYAGPLLVKPRKDSATSAEKRWICLFTCASTRGVHLEIVNNLTTEEFLMAFTRFASRRGKPNHLYSDNAPTFKKAARHLADVTWQFIPPAAPWWGGFWERLVRSIKAPLKKILGKALVTDKELSTLIIRIEEQINSRPLTALVDDPDQVPLTPAEILIGRSLQQPKELSSDIPPPHAAFSARQRYLKSLQQSWTKRWVQEYLPTLQPRTKWHRDSDNITPGSLVLLKKENQKRHLWPLAKVIETHVGRDGNVRSVTLQDDRRNLIKRPIQNLVLLEGTDNE